MQPPVLKQQVEHVGCTHSILSCSQGSATLAAEVVFAARADGTSQAQCPVTVTDRGNGTHELSFVSTVVRSCNGSAHSEAATSMVATQSHHLQHAMHLTLTHNHVSDLFDSRPAKHCAWPVFWEAFTRDVMTSCRLAPLSS